MNEHEITMREIYSTNMYARATLVFIIMYFKFKLQLFEFFKNKTAVKTIILYLIFEPR